MLGISEWNGQSVNTTIEEEGFGDFCKNGASEGEFVPGDSDTEDWICCTKYLKVAKIQPASAIPFQFRSNDYPDCQTQIRHPTTTHHG